MPTLVSDPTSTMYVVFGAMVVILGAMALRRRKKSDVITFAVGAVLLLALFLIDRANESPREQVSRKLAEMESSSQARKYDEVFKHISEDFKYKSLDKKALREKANQAQSYFPEGIRIWNVTRNSYKPMEGGTVEQEFDVQPVNNPQFRYQCVGVFKKDADGEWRMVTFRLYPVVGSGGEGGKREEVTPPGL
jgi:hypothetical protein